MTVIVVQLLSVTQCVCRQEAWHASLTYGSIRRLETEIKFVWLSLQILSKRIHFGKFVAEAKFRENPAAYETAIREQVLSF